MEQKFFEHTTPDGQKHKIAYTKWGSGEDLLVCVHGLTRNGRDFDWLADAMCDKYTVICPSMPGRGKSDWLENAEHYSNEYNIELTLALINSIPHKNLDWMGTSMGGIMGMVIAATMPKLIRKMVLNDIGALISEEGMRRIKTYVKGEVKFDTRESAETRFREIFAPFNIKEEADWLHYLEHGLREVIDVPFDSAESQMGSAKNDSGTLKAGSPPDSHAARKSYWSFNHDPKMGAAFPEPQEVDMWRLWNGVNVPTLILRGGESDILPKDIAEQMAKRENARLVEFAGFGHVPPLIDQEQINVVRGFLCS